MSREAGKGQQTACPIDASDNTKSLAEPAPASEAQAMRKAPVVAIKPSGKEGQVAEAAITNRSIQCIHELRNDTDGFKPGRLGQIV